VERHNGRTILPFFATLKLGNEQRELLREFIQMAPVREVSITISRVHVKTAMIESPRLTIVKSLPTTLSNDTGEVILL
jgi:hypothetical protein